VTGTYVAIAPVREICVIESLANWLRGEHVLRDQVNRQVPIIGKGTMDDDAERGCRGSWIPRRAHNACLVDHGLTRSYQIVSGTTGYAGDQSYAPRRRSPTKSTRQEMSTRRKFGPLPILFDGSVT
jgi:hypothetical protein